MQINNRSSWISSQITTARAVDCLQRSAHPVSQSAVIAKRPSTNPVRRARTGLTLRMPTRRRRRDTPRTAAAAENNVRQVPLAGRHPPKPNSKPLTPTVITLILKSKVSISTFSFSHRRDHFSASPTKFRQSQKFATQFFCSMCPHYFATNPPVTPMFHQRSADSLPGF